MRTGQINALHRIRTKAAQYTNHTKDCGKIARLCVLFKAYSGERSWKVIRDRLRRPYYFSEVYYVRNIGDRKQRTDSGKYSFVNKKAK